jgi:CheY-like chemotaxis protein
MAPIMVVDDNPFNIETLKMLITKITKIVPDTANDGNVAVEKFIQRYKTLTSSTDQQNQG